MMRINYNSTNFVSYEQMMRYVISEADFWKEYQTAEKFKSVYDETLHPFILDAAIEIRRLLLKREDCDAMNPMVFIPYKHPKEKRFQVLIVPVAGEVMQQSQTKDMIPLMVRQEILTSMPGRAAGCKVYGAILATEAWTTSSSWDPSGTVEIQQPKDDPKHIDTLMFNPDFYFGGGIFSYNVKSMKRIDPNYGWLPDIMGIMSSMFRKAIGIYEEKAPQFKVKIK